MEIRLLMSVIGHASLPRRAGDLAEPGRGGRSAGDPYNGRSDPARAAPVRRGRNAPQRVAAPVPATHRAIAIASSSWRPRRRGAAGPSTACPAPAARAPAFAKERCHRAAQRSARRPAAARRPGAWRRATEGGAVAGLRLGHPGGRGWEDSSGQESSLGFFMCSSMPW